MSEFKFACPVCGQHIKSDSSASGTQIECPTCFQKILVPQAPTDVSSKFILSAAQAPGKRPLTVIADAQPDLKPRSHRGAYLWAGSAAGILALAALVSAKLGVFKARPVANTLSQTNLVTKTVPKFDAPDPRWRLDLKDVAIPTNTASGRIWGREFHLQRATIHNGSLTLFQGASRPPDLGVTIQLPKQPPQDFAGKQFSIPKDYAGKGPRVVLRTKDDQQKEATTGFASGYAMKLEFDQIAENRLPGRLYLCMPDQDKSVVVGSFSARILEPEHR